MNKPFLLKILGMFVLITLISIAVSYVNNIILERQRNQSQVKADIAKSSVRAQTVIGPVFAVPYTEEYTDYIDEYTPQGVKTQKAITKHINATAYFLPENLEFSGGFSNEYKKLGIYQALMYQLGGRIKGDFRLPAHFNITPTHKGGTIALQKAFIGLGISDTRGISGQPVLSFNQQSYRFEQGSNIDALGNGIHATINDIDTEKEQIISFSLDLNLLGMEDFNFTPIAENNQIKLNSSWPHPHFDGSFLPIKKQINDGGFQAEWAVSSLSSTNQSTFMNRIQSTQSASDRWLESLSIRFIEPINVYSQADRATKYGLLFIGLTFVGFYLFEILKHLRIHPAQYTLVGLAMTMFYLLLISFAERIGFAFAYLIASGACILLLGYYLSYVLKSKVNGLLFATLLTTLYGALYGILASEDNALIMGSLLVFGLLATTMVVTRKIDWYALNLQK